MPCRQLLAQPRTRLDRVLPWVAQFPQVLAERLGSQRQESTSDVDCKGMPAERPHNFPSRIPFGAAFRPPPGREQTKSVILGQHVEIEALAERAVFSAARCRQCRGGVPACTPKPF